MATGRPFKYTDPVALQKAVDGYFKSCIKDKQHPGIVALSLSLGFVNRQSMLDYMNREDRGGDFVALSDIIKTAKARVEAHLEQHLYGNNATGSIFNLKCNFKWVDKQVIESNMFVPLADMLGDALKKDD